MSDMDPDVIDRIAGQRDRFYAENITVRAENERLREVLKSTGLFLHHCWCDVQMNEYSFQKLSEQMEIVDAALAAGGE